MRLMIVAAGLVALAGCNRPAERGAGAPGTAATTASTAIAGSDEPDWSVENACALLDNPTVGAALGTKIVSNELSEVRDGGGRASRCHYRLENGDVLTFTARQAPAGGISPVASAADGPAEAVHGVGKAASWSPLPRRLVVLLESGCSFDLTMPAKLDGKDPKMLALGLATRVK